MKFAEINTRKSTPCSIKDSRKRERAQRPRLTPIEKRMLSLLGSLADESGSVMKPMRYYAAELRTTRQKCKNVLQALERKGALRIREEWQDGIKRMRLTLKEKRR